MTKTNPLIKLRLLLTIIWAVTLSFVLISSKESQPNIWILPNVILIGLSIVTILLGWLMVVRKENVFTLYENLSIRFTEKILGQEEAKNLVSMLSKPNRRKWLGIMNLIVGIGLLIIAIMGLAILVSG